MSRDGIVQLHTDEVAWSSTSEARVVIDIRGTVWSTAGGDRPRRRLVVRR